MSTTTPSCFLSNLFRFSQMILWNGNFSFPCGTTLSPFPVNFQKITTQQQRHPFCLIRSSTPTLTVLLRTKKNGYQNQLGTRILLLKLVLLMAEQDLFYPSHTKSTSSLQKELLSYIQQNYCFRISLHDLARHFHMSEKYISRYFREHFQLTLSQYITYLRLSHAKHLLETTSLSITETALQSGFPNVSYFIRTFKNTFHVPPLQYRNSIR